MFVCIYVYLTMYINVYTSMYKRKYGENAVCIHLCSLLFALKKKERKVISNKIGLRSICTSMKVHLDIFDFV